MREGVRKVLKRRKLRLGTRKSPLALFQSDWVRIRLQQHNSEIEIELVPLQTSGDLIEGSLAEVGGKALFVRELDSALIAGEIDLAVHSLKDVPGVLADGVAIAAYTKRWPAHDLLISRHSYDLTELGINAKVGTISPRRKFQLLAARPDLQILPLRGNVGTRLRKLEAGEFDAIVLAAAGIERLELMLESSPLSFDVMIPAIGQGTIAVTTRANDSEILNYIKTSCEDENNLLPTIAERSLLKSIGGDCDTPLGGYATIEGNQIVLRAFYSTPDGNKYFRHEMTSNIDLKAAEELGVNMSEYLKNKLAN